MAKKTTRITPLGKPMTVDPRLRTKERQLQVDFMRAVVSFLDECVVTDVAFGEDDAIVGLVLKSGEGE